MAQIPPGVAMAAYRMQLAGDPEEMIVTCGHSAEGVGGDYQGLADTLRAIFESTWQPQLRVTYTFVGVSLYIGQDGGASFVYESIDPVAGAASSEGLPQNCALLVEKRTNQAGRRGKGRLYMPGVLGESTVSETGVLNTTAYDSTLVRVETWYTALADPLNVGCEPVLLHATAPFDPTPISEFGIDPVIVTQRQRLRR